MNRRHLTIGMAALPATALAARAAPAQPRTWKGGVLIEMTAIEAVEAMRRGEVTAETYAQALLARCEGTRALNAFITLQPDKVLAEARAADLHRRMGGRLGALHGLPIPVKDSVNTADHPTTAGTRALRGYVPATDAAVVARLRAAGAHVLGKTNLHELSFGWTSNNAEFGPVRNPYDLARIPGGSTGGTAAAVAARMAPLGVAEDTQGSIRVPAALCGICGFRPTTGRYPSAGTAPISPLFDQVGSHARSVRDLVLFDQVMTGEASPIRPARLKGLRIGVVRDPYFAGIDADVGRVIADVLRALADAGVVLVEASLPGLSELAGQVAGPVQTHDLGPSFRRWLTEGGAKIGFEAVLAEVSPPLRASLERFALTGAAGATSEEAYRLARDERRPALQRMLADGFKTHDIAAMIFPATMTVAPLIGAEQTVPIDSRQVPFRTAVARNITPGSSAGLPGLVTPAGLSAGGLPVGIELDGPAGSDRSLLAIGLAVERVLKPIPAPMV